MIIQMNIFSTNHFRANNNHLLNPRVDTSVGKKKKNHTTLTKYAYYLNGPTSITEGCVSHLIFVIIYISIYIYLVSDLIVNNPCDRLCIRIAKPHTFPQVTMGPISDANQACFA